MSALLFVSILHPAAVSHWLLKTSELAQSHSLRCVFPFPRWGSCCGLDSCIDPPALEVPGHWVLSCYIYHVFFLQTETPCHLLKWRTDSETWGSKSGEVLSQVTEVTGKSSRRSMQCVIKARTFLWSSSAMFLITPPKNIAALLKSLTLRLSMLSLQSFRSLLSRQYKIT